MEIKEGFILKIKSIVYFLCTFFVMPVAVACNSVCQNQSFGHNFEFDRFEKNEDCSEVFLYQKIAPRKGCEGKDYEYRYRCNNNPNSPGYKLWELIAVTTYENGTAVNTDTYDSNYTFKNETTNCTLAMVEPDTRLKFAQNVPIYTKCDDGQYHAMTEAGERKEICCNKYKLAVEENGAFVCADVASEKGSFYLYGKEVRCRDEGSFPRKLEEGPVTSEQEEYTENGYVCRYCPIGYYCDGYKKMVCPAGKFSSTMGHSVNDDFGGCITCSTNGYFCPGAITENNNGWKNADDKDISYITSIKSAAFPDVALNPEQYSGYEIICPEGYYTNRDTGYGHCQKCLAGRTTDGEGQSSCDAYKYTDMNFTKTDSNSGWKWPQGKFIEVTNALYRTYKEVSQN